MMLKHKCHWSFELQWVVVRLEAAETKLGMKFKHDRIRRAAFIL